MKMTRHFLCRTTVLLIGAPTIAQAEFLTVYGGATFDPQNNSGFVDPFVPFQQYGVSAAGNAVASARKRDGAINLGRRAFRWDASGVVAVELDNLGINSAGVTDTVANAVNATGLTVGTSTKFSGNTNLGRRAVRWDPGTAAVVELGHLGTNPSGVGNSSALVVNSAGTAAGTAHKYNSTLDLGARAVRWDAGGTAATELQTINTDLLGRGTAEAFSINAAGTVVGTAIKHDGNTSLGNRAVRWNAGTTTITELGTLEPPTSGVMGAYAFAVAADGSAFGYSQKCDGDTLLGERAVRWDAGSTVARELDNLGASTTGFAYATVFAVNPDGTAVGYADKFTDTGGARGLRAVKWNRDTTAATELGNLGTNSGGVSIAIAHAINSAGIASGFCWRYENDVSLGDQAVLWMPDGSIVDLNAFIDPASGWTLRSADSISDTNFVSGVGQFDPDGAGPLPSYNRAFVLNAASVVPEPHDAVFFLAPFLWSMSRRFNR